MDNGFDRAQAQYDAQEPPEGNPTMTCSTCDGEGTVGEGEDIKPCPDCSGEGKVQMTDEELRELNDSMRQDEYDRTHELD